MELKRLSLVLLTLVGCSVSVSTQGQTSSVFCTGLRHPTKIVAAPGHSLLVAEGGNLTPNTGRISIIDQFTGDRHTLIDGLPSGVSNLGGTEDTDGTTGLYLSGKDLYVVTGVGDSVVNVGPGLELPNPAGASSPIFNSIIQIALPGNFTALRSGFSLQLADQDKLANNIPVVLFNQHNQMIAIRMVSDLPDYRAEPRPFAPDNVRASHLFGVEIFQSQLYVVDAGLNLIHQVSLNNGAVSTFVSFPVKPNPLFPALGGPVVEPVPDNVHRIGNCLIVPLLTGFPFLPATSEIQSVSLKDGRRTTLIPGLSSAIDVLPVETINGVGYFTLEFSANQLGGLPGRLRFFNSANGTPETILPVVITPTSMVRDEKTGDIFITNIFPGTVTRVKFE